MSHTKYDPDIPLIEGEEHRKFLGITYDIAWNFSQDNSTKTGAVLVARHKDRRLIVGVGYNHFRGITPTPEQMADSMWKRDHITHAEPAGIEDAIAYINKIFRPVSTLADVDVDMYTNWAMCSPCTRRAVESRIKRVIIHRQMVNRTPLDWVDDLENGREMIRDSDTRLFMYSGDIGGVKGLMRRVEWEP